MSTVGVPLAGVLPSVVAGAADAPVVAAALGAAIGEEYVVAAAAAAGAADGVGSDAVARFRPETSANCRECAAGCTSPPGTLVVVCGFDGAAENAAERFSVKEFPESSCSRFCTQRPTSAPPKDPSPFCGIVKMLQPPQWLKHALHQTLGLLFGGKELHFDGQRLAGLVHTQGHLAPRPLLGMR